jgi:hypothetical protein
MRQFAQLLIEAREPRVWRVSASGPAAIPRLYVRYEIL